MAVMINAFLVIYLRHLSKKIKRMPMTCVGEGAWSRHGREGTHGVEVTSETVQKRTNVVITTDAFSDSCC